MYLHLGNARMEKSDYVGAIRLFERARPQMRYDLAHRLLTVSLVRFLIATMQSIGITHDFFQISGWKFDSLNIMIGQRFCEALYAAGRIQDAGESVLELINTSGEDVNLNRPTFTQWISGEFSYCSSMIHLGLRRFYASMSLRFRKRYNPTQ